MPDVWGLRARLYDMCEASELRRGTDKAALFADMAGRVLFVALGTGLDIRHFPPQRQVVGIDISQAMLDRARPRQRRYAGTLRFARADAQRLCFPDAAFDTVATSCTMCSVPDSVRTLRELYRVLRPGGRLLMFEHVASRNALLRLALGSMNLISRRGGTDMTRETLGDVAAAGFRILEVRSVFLDIIVAVRAERPAAVIQLRP